MPFRKYKKRENHAWIKIFGIFQKNCIYYFLLLLFDLSPNHCIYWFIPKTYVLCTITRIYFFCHDILSLKCCISCFVHQRKGAFIEHNEKNFYLTHYIFIIIHLMGEKSTLGAPINIQTNCTLQFRWHSAYLFQCRDRKTPRHGDIVADKRLYSL